MIELGDIHMYLATPEGIRVEYPRHKLEAWERTEESRPSDRRFGVRLRILFAASHDASATASPLDLMFEEVQSLAKHYFMLCKCGRSRKR